MEILQSNGMHDLFGHSNLSAGQVIFFSLSSQFSSSELSLKINCVKMNNVQILNILNQFTNNRFVSHKPKILNNKLLYVYIELTWSFLYFWNYD